MVNSALLIQILVGAEDRVRNAHSLAGTEWQQLIRIASKAQLLTLFHRQIGQLGLPLPDDLAHALRESVRPATVESLRKQAELVALLDNFNRSDLRPILFKGAVLAHTVYPSPALRSMGDIDLWVPREAIARARTILESLGYNHVEKSHRSHEFQSLGDGELQMRRQGSAPSLVELHYGVFAGEWMRLTTRIDRSAVFKRLRPVTILGRPAWQLSAEDAFIQIVLHVGINHQMSVNTLRSLVDLEFLAQQGMDWEIVRQRSQEWCVYTAVSFVIHYWNELFATEKSRQAAERLPFSRKRLLSRFVRPEDLLEGVNLSWTRWRLFYQLCLIDRGLDVIRLMTHTLWPDRAWLQARYNETRPWIRLVHLRQVLSGKV